MRNVTVNEMRTAFPDFFNKHTSPLAAFRDPHAELHFNVYRGYLIVVCFHKYGDGTKYQTCPTYRFDPTLPKFDRLECIGTFDTQAIAQQRIRDNIGRRGPSPASLGAVTA